MSSVCNMVIFHFHDWRKSSATGFQFSLRASTFQNHAAFHTYIWVYLKNPRFSQSNPVVFGYVSGTSCQLQNRSPPQ